MIVGVCLLGVGAVLGMNPAADWYARRYLREHYPWLQPRTVVFHYPFTEVRLTETTFDRGWVSGTLSTIVVTRQSGWGSFAVQSIKVTGGTVTADLDKRVPGTGESEKRPLMVEGLTVHASKGRFKGMAVGVGWDGRLVTFATAGLETPWAKVETTSGSYEPKVRVILAKAGARVAVPVKIPGIQLDEVNLTAEDITLDEATGEVRAGRVVAVQPSAPDLELLTAGGVRVVNLTSPASVSFRAAWVQFQHPWLSPKPERVEKIYGAVYQKPYLMITLYDPINVNIMPDEQSVLVQGSCQEWADVVARDTVLQTVAFEGRLHIGVGMKPIPNVRMDQALMPANCVPTSCQVFQGLRRPFRYTAIKADGTPVERTSGPGTAEWVPIGAAGKMPMAVETLEDPGFHYHHGFIRQAYENSLIENVRTGKFTRGGSTLTMQLAKNLYLQRNKTLLRKAQELLLAMALEKCLTKSEIIELYLNVVEFGPNTYGIGPGAKLWFGKSPEALDPVEAFWLASILPRPRKAGPPTELALKGTSRLMESLAKQGKIPGFVGGFEEVDATGWEANP